MRNWTIRIITFFMAVISLFSLAACSNEKKSDETKAMSTTTVPITTESIAPAQATTLPATTEAQTDIPTTEPTVDLSGVPFKEDSFCGAKYITPKYWECRENDFGSKFYQADAPYGAYIFVISTYTETGFMANYNETVTSIINSLRSNWPDCTSISTDSLDLNNNLWIVDKLESTDGKYGDFRFTISENGVFYFGAVYPKNGRNIPRFLAIYEKMFESIDLKSFYVEKPITSIMDYDSDIVLVDDDYVRITFQGMETNTSYYSIYPVVANFLIENKTDKSIHVAIGFNDLSVNEYMCSATMYAEMSGNKKTHATIGFTEENLKQADIISPSEIKEMEWTFHVIDNSSYITLEEVPVKLSIYD